MEPELLSPLIVLSSSSSPPFVSFNLYYEGQSIIRRLRRLWARRCEAKLRGGPFHNLFEVLHLYGLTRFKVSQNPSHLRLMEQHEPRWRRTSSDFPVAFFKRRLQSRHKLALMTLRLRPSECSEQRNGHDGQKNYFRAHRESSFRVLWLLIRRRGTNTMVMLLDRTAAGV